MKKISAIISSLEQADKINNLVDAFLVPLNEYSINYTNTFSVDEIIKLKKYNKEIFVFINKNIHNNEIENLKKILIEVDKLNLNGIIFYDISILTLKKELNLKTNLVWHQEHMTNNYATVNYYYEKGVKYAYLSSEITKREIEEIKNKTKSKLFLTVFGYVPIFTSKRHLVDNYLNTFNIKNKGNKIYKEGKNYNIIDVKNGTTVYTNYILNIKENIDIDYLVFNSNMIDTNEFINVLKDYKNNKFKEETGFLYKETIYKVK